VEPPEEGPKKKKAKNESKKTETEGQQDTEEVMVPLRKKPKISDDDAAARLASLADQIKNNIRAGDETKEEEPKKKKQKPLKGENFEFIKVAEKVEPQGNAFLTRAQRKTMKRGKKTTVNKESIKKMMDKETKLKFDKELVYVKPFKKLDKPEVVGSHPGKLKLHDPEKTPTKSALKVKTTPKRIGHGGKIKWQG